MARIFKYKQNSCNILSRFLNSARTRSVQTLAYEEVRSSSHRPYTSTAFVLHGLLGSGRNWRSFSRCLVSRLSQISPSSEWRMVVVDLRNHGRSADIEGLEPPHNIATAANDLANLIKAKVWDSPDVVMGHSLGGKVALHFAQSCARAEYGQSLELPKQGNMGISPPSNLPSTVNLFGYGGPKANLARDGKMHQSTKRFYVVRWIWGSNLHPRTRTGWWLVNHMVELGFSKSLSEWISSNLKKSGEHDTWAFNLDGAVQMFNSYREMSYWPLLEHPPQGTEISFVRAENSDRWDPDVIQRLEGLASRQGDGSLGKVSVHVLPNAGHWVHVDNPKGLLDIVAPRIASV